MLMRTVDDFGRKAIVFFDEMGQLILLFLQIIQACFQRPFYLRNTLNHMVETGVNSMVVTMITSLSTGMVLALQTGTTLEHKMQGISQYLGTIVCMPMVRELGPVLTALVVAGRVGSANAAEIGTMKVTEQIDALATLATNPVKYLAVPRFLACLLMLPILTIFADMIGVFGGFVVVTTKLNMSGYGFIQNALDFLKWQDIMSGLIKSVFFGGIIAVVSCHKGFTTSGGAEGVGRATTGSVVVSFMGILISDYFLTALLF